MATVPGVAAEGWLSVGFDCYYFIVLLFKNIIWYKYNTVFINNFYELNQKFII